MARWLSYEAEQLMAKGAASIMRYDEMRAVLKNHFRVALQRKQDHIAAHGRLDHLEVAALSNGYAFAQEAEQAKQDIFNGLVQSDDDLIDGFSRRYGLTLEPGTDAYAQFRTEMRRAYRDYCKAALDYDQSLGTYSYTDSMPVQSDQARDETPKVTLEKIVQRFVDEEMRAERWTRHSADQKRQYLDVLQEILGKGRDIGSVRAPEAQKVKETLLRYPKNRNKNPKTRGLSLEAVLELKGIETLTVRTINAYLQTYAALFAWARRNGYVQENAFDGVSLREKRRSQEADRDAFSPAQVDHMLRELLTNKAGLIRKEFQKWGPLIGIYSGARLNEICQIHLKDIRQIDGIWCFDLNDEGEGKKLKNMSSRRCVPIHSQLLENGFLDYVSVVRERGAERLFPDFSYSAKEGYGRTLGRWFNERFLVELGIKTEALVFHSLRHTMVTRLMQAGVEENLVKAIVGHTREGVTQQHYFKQGYTVTQLKDALERY
ncbi:site-specific tyrosine recombinase XerD [Devosia equisanguinis]|uniref:Site-specific tyrosine recombinase XerD n=1 Tax=Devosia equisanguinis TaxID=2490941 RepID=A0A447IAI7_9HYPH|nr:site-specific integrase [Devosia equisanguinis]VDS04425.1 site-specific tyrosine recombinase XerD [Devosia equisanguinis]